MWEGSGCRNSICCFLKGIKEIHSSHRRNHISSVTTDVFFVAIHIPEEALEEAKSLEIRESHDT